MGSHGEGCCYVSSRPAGEWMCGLMHANLQSRAPGGHTGRDNNKNGHGCPNGVERQHAATPAINQGRARESAGGGSAAASMMAPGSLQP